MKKIEVGRLWMRTKERGNAQDGYLLRGFVARLFRENELAHNHDRTSGKPHYRYPMLQYKIVEGNALILALGEEAIELCKKIFCRIEKIRLGRKEMDVEESRIDIREEELGLLPEMHAYQFVTPWFALNSENYRKYEKANEEEKDNLLRQCLVGNVLSLSKYLDYHVPDRIEVTHSLHLEPQTFKEESVLGFRGTFAVNFKLPDWIGMGKSPSRGYGTCVKIGGWQKNKDSSSFV